MDSKCQSSTQYKCMFAQNASPSSYLNCVLTWDMCRRERSSANHDRGLGLSQVSERDIPYSTDSLSQGKAPALVSTWPSHRNIPLLTCPREQ